MIKPTLVIAFLSVAVLASQPAQAVTKRWVLGGSDWWDDGNNWNPTGQPTHGDDVLLAYRTDYDVSVMYRNTTYPSAVLNSLIINGSLISSMTLIQDSLNLSVIDETIGYDGIGSYIQNNGTHTIQNNLSMGMLYDGGLDPYYGTGTYTLNGGTLNVEGDVINGPGTSTLNYNGGILAVAGALSLDNFHLGQESGSNVAFTIDHGDNITVQNESVGIYGVATVNQTGGTHNIYSLFMGQNDNTYNLSGGMLTVNQTKVSGGAMNQSGGVFNAGSLDIRRDGTFNLSGTGELIISGRVNVRGSFVQTGGNHELTSEIADLIVYDLAEAATYELKGGSLTAGNEIIGLFSRGAYDHRFVQTGGTNTVTNELTLAPNAGSTGTYDLLGGTLDANVITVNTGGAFNFDGGRLNVDTFQGNLTNNGGTLAPGASAGTTTILGDYSIQNISSILEIELGGNLAGEYDVVDITGTADLDGTLEVLLYDGFNPNPGDTFNILSADSIEGSFNLLLLPTLEDDLIFELKYLLDPVNTDLIQLQVSKTIVPIPSTFILMGFGLFLFFIRYRRKGARG